MRQVVNKIVVALYDLCASTGKKPCTWNKKTKLFEYDGDLRLRYDPQFKILHLEKINGPGEAIPIWSELNPSEFCKAVSFMIFARERM